MTSGPLAHEGSPVYLVKSDDPTLLGEALGRLVREVLDGADHGTAVEDASGSPDDDREAVVAAAVEACQTPAFLTPIRVVMLREVGRFTTEQVGPLLDYLADPLPTSVLVMTGGGGTVPQKLAAAVKKAGHVIDVSAPRKDRLGWVVDRVKESGLKLDAAAGRRLADHLGEDVGRIGSVLDALQASFGAGASIGAADLDPFLGEAGALAPWDLTDAIDQGRIDDALVVLHRMLEGGGRHPLVVMVTLTSHFTNMLKLDGSGITREADAAALLGIHAFRAKKAMAQARTLGSRGIADGVELLARADVDLRGGSDLPDVLVLEMLVARLCRLARSPARSR